jgi:N6-adenosine-specific RNA methylase IME4
MKKYQIIYADPPWEQKGGTLFGKYKVVNGKQVWNMVSNLSQNLPYKTLNIENIKKLPIKNITDDNAVLFIWVTNKYLPFVFKVIESWGFNYSSTICWCKTSFGLGLGGTVRVSSEYLIFCRKGSLKSNKYIKSWYQVKREYVNGYPQHSRKPSFFRNLISETFNGNKIEIFARQKTENWDVWGNEVESDINLTGGSK